ncbi:MMPL family transporter [Nocardia lasii]|uniref:MMPL family transporter n=1 Tax=Nocardia lasii TaxID=1616107 RepID=A0ABW1JPR4_9NOCA
MFTRWGDLVYRFRFAVIVVVGAAMLALGAYGMGLGPRLSQSGWFDPGSESVQGAQIADGSFGRDHMADVIVMYNAPEGKTIDDPEFSQKVIGSLTSIVNDHPDQIGMINGTYWKVGDAPAVPSAFGSKDKKHAFASIAIEGDNDTVMMANYRAVADVFYIPGVDVEVSGLQPLAVTLNDTIAHDTKRMEVLALPAVAILLFFIFGGIVAAALPLIIGGLTIIGATGLVMVLTNFTEVNSFVTGVVSMIGLGLAIDYGLFIVSRFREELAEGYDTRAAVRRSVMTAGRTVVFSATMIIASLGGILLFPQGFLRSVAYGTIATVSLAALTAVTILPAMLAVLGPRVDLLGLKRFRKTKTAEQIENGFWGNMTRWVMKHPLKIAIPITVGLLLLIIPVKDLAFGGINEKYLPPDNPTRSALEHFYEVFPQKKTDPIQLVFVSDNTTAIGKVWKEANQAPGLVGPFDVPTKSPTNAEVFRTSATLVDPTGDVAPTIDYLRGLEIPDGVTMYVTGQPTLMADSIDTLLHLMPWMIALVLITTTVLMFLTFGSLVLPIKAALMSALGLGSTLGILTWIFVDGHGASLLNFTPQPISAPVLMLIIAIIYGLSTDYEVFLLSRMVEARAQGASTTEAVRIGTAQTGRIITAAALILLVVTGAFAFSDMVMMQYIAYGMIAALFIDATVLRMLLVPAIMKLLGDDCWWAPKWMKRIQEKIGLGEPILDDERPGTGDAVDLVKTTPITDPPTMQMKAVPDSKLARTPRRPRTVAEIESEAPTQRMDKITETDEPARSRAPISPDPTRPRAAMLSSGEPTQVLPVVKPGATPEDLAAAPEDSGLDVAKPESGEPTRVLPIVKPGTPNPALTKDDPPTDNDPDASAPTRDNASPTTNLGDPETGPGGATRTTNGSTSGATSFGTIANAQGSSGFGAGSTRQGSTSFGTGSTPQGDTDFDASSNPKGNTGSSASRDPQGPAGFGARLNLEDSTGFGTGSTPQGDAGFGTSSNPEDSTGFGASRDPQSDSGFGARSNLKSSTGFGTSPAPQGDSGFGASPNPESNTGFGTSSTPQGDAGFGARSNAESSTGFGASPAPQGDTSFKLPSRRTDAQARPDGVSALSSDSASTGSQSLGDTGSDIPRRVPDAAARPTSDISLSGGAGSLSLDEATDVRSDGQADARPVVDTFGASPSPAGFTGPSFGTDPRPAVETPSGRSTSDTDPADSADSDLVLPGLDSPTRPRGSERVQPPTGYTAGVIGDTPPTGPASTESSDNTGFPGPATVLPQRPSIIPPARPNVATPPPISAFPPPAPSIVNPPTGVTPRAADNPPSGVTPRTTDTPPTGINPPNDATPHTGEASSSGATFRAPETPPSIVTPPRGVTPRLADNAPSGINPPNGTTPRTTDNLPGDVTPRPTETSPSDAAAARTGDASSSGEAFRAASTSPSGVTPREAGTSPSGIDLTDGASSSVAENPSAGVTPASADNPPSGTFSGFNPVTESNFRPIRPFSRPPESSAPAAPGTGTGAGSSRPLGSDTPTGEADSSARESASRASVFVPPTDLSATPGAHRADALAGTASESATEREPSDSSRRESSDSAHGVFGTPVPVEPQQPSSPWNNGMTGPGTPRGFTTPEPEHGSRFASATPSADSTNGSAGPAAAHPDNSADSPNPSVSRPDSPRLAQVRPQVAPTGFTAVPLNNETGPLPISLLQQGEANGRGDDESAPGQWQAPSGFTAVPASPAESEAAFDATEQAEQRLPASAPAEPENDSPTAESGGADTRNEIENWMAQLRSSRRGTPADEGRHHGGEGRTVSVNELLRRREDDTN